MSEINNILKDVKLNCRNRHNFVAFCYIAIEGIGFDKVSTKSAQKQDDKKIAKWLRYYQLVIKHIITM